MSAPYRRDATSVGKMWANPRGAPATQIPNVLFTCANTFTASVRAEGVEPSRSLEHRHLKPACLPFHHARSGADRTARRFEKICRRLLLNWVDHGGERGKQVRPAQEFAIVQRLIADRLNNCAIARQTGVPRRTVSDWRRRPPVRSRDSGELPCRLPQGRGGAPRRIRMAQIVSGTVKGCPLRVVAGLR